MAKKPLIGFVGQGFIGKSYADDMERRGYRTVRYALEQPYRGNKDQIRNCDIVFIAVPTPTVPRRSRVRRGGGGRPNVNFDYSIVAEALKLVGRGRTAVIKSTILPGTTRTLQRKFPSITAMHSPEFLVLKQAAEDAARPMRNIIGIAQNSKTAHAKAKQVMSVLPRAPLELICSVEEAELIKYGGNLFLYLKVLFANVMFDAARIAKADYETVRKGLGADPRIGVSHLQVLHDSGHTGARKGRGAGGVCFIKDIAAFAEFYKKAHDPAGNAFLQGAIGKNVQLLRDSKKDIDLLKGVYGESIL